MPSRLRKQKDARRAAYVANSDKDVCTLSAYNKLFLPNV